MEKYREVFYAIFWLNEGSLIEGDSFLSESEAHAFADSSEDDRDYVVMPVHLRRVVQPKVSRLERVTRLDREPDEKKTKSKTKTETP